MRNLFGNMAVSGDDFYGRAAVVNLLKSILISGNSFLLLGLRRIGKSSTVKEALRLVRIEKPEMVVVELNCQTYKTLKDFYVELYRSLPDDWRLKLRKALQESRKLPTKIVDVITDHIEEVSIPGMAGVKLRNDIIDYSSPIKEEITKFFESQKEHIILSIDEMPFLFEAISKSGRPTTVLEIESLLTTLRDWRNIGVSQAITGSINLHVQLEELGISRKLLAGVTSQKLPKYTLDEATGLLHALADSQGVHLTGNQIEKMVSTIPDFIPQYLQHYFFNVKLHFAPDMDVEEVYHEYVYPAIVQDFEYQFEERISSLQFDDFAIAKEILNQLLNYGETTQKEVLEQIDTPNTYKVLLKLMEFEFIEMDIDHNCDFALNIIKNWWKKK